MLSVVEEWPETITNIFVTTCQDNSAYAEDLVWTLSPSPTKLGWKTDSGYGGYGLPKLVAEEIARRFNILTKIESVLEAARRHIRSFEPGTLEGSELNLALQLLALDGDIWLPWSVREAPAPP